MTRTARAPEAESLGESHTLGMAEMGFAGLSEQWLMRRAGDLHWRLIAGAMGQAEAVFTCAEGRPLYAAFCASRLALTDPEAPRLGGGLDLETRLYRVGRSRLGSLTALRVAGRVIGQLALVSVFVGRSEGGGNRALVRRAPRVLALPDLTAPDLDRLAASAARAAAWARAWRPEGRAVTLLPTPSVDFNAAGLLYFPSFAALADRASFAAGLSHAAPLRARAVAYLGNVEQGEPVSVVPIPRRDGGLALVTGADHRPLAILRARH
jgi:probable biosynthetic protein (TIGR04099 family)